MPQIPSFKRRRIAAPGAQPRVDVRAARAGGQAIAQLGRGISEFGEALGDYQKERAKIDQNLIENQSRLAAQGAGQLSENEARTSPDLKPSGDNLIDGFNTSFDRAQQTFINSLDSDEDRAQAGQAFQVERLNRQEKLFTASRRMHADNAVVQSENLQRGFELSVFNDPDSFGSELNNFNQHLDSMNMLVGPKTEELKTQGREDLAMNSILGLIEQQEYDQATERIKTGAEAKFLDSKTRQGLLLKVDQAKMRETDLDLKEENRKVAEENRERKESQDNNFQKMQLKINVAGDLASRQNLEKEIDASVSTDQMNRQQAIYLKNVMNDSTGVNNDAESFRLTSQFLTEKDPIKFREQVITAVNNQRIDAKTGQQLLLKSNQIERQIKDDPFKRMKIAAGNRFVDKLMGEENLIRFLRKPEQIAKRNATFRYIELLEAGAQPEVAARQAVREFGKTSESLPRPKGVDNNLLLSTDTIKQALVQAREQFNRDGDKKKFNQTVLRIKSIRDALRLEEELTNITKESK